MLQSIVQGIILGLVSTMQLAILAAFSRLLLAIM